MNKIMIIGQLLCEALKEQVPQPDSFGQMEQELRQLLQECGGQEW